jgi:hypothetical protein
MNNVPAVTYIQRQPGANIIQVVDRIKRLLPQLAVRCPRPFRSRSDGSHLTIRASVADVSSAHADRRARGDGDFLLRNSGDDHPECCGRCLSWARSV